MILEIAQSDFVSWKNHPTTKFIHAYLEEVIKECKEELVSERLICNPDGLLRLNKTLGYMQAVEDFIHLDVSATEDTHIDGEQ